MGSSEQSGSLEQPKESQVAFPDRKKKRLMHQREKSVNNLTAYRVALSVLFTETGNQHATFSHCDMPKSFNIKGSVSCSPFSRHVLGHAKSGSLSPAVSQFLSRT